MKRTAAPEQNNDAIVSSMKSGIGTVVKFQASLSNPMVPENANICAQAMDVLIRAVREVLLEQQQGANIRPRRQLQPPPLTVISTTGISHVTEVVPFYLRAFHHHILATPHAGKRRMEDLAKAAMDTTAAATSGPYMIPISPTVFRGLIAVCIALLKGDHKITSGKGWMNLRVGTEANPTVGCAVYRADVGQWILEEVVLRGEKWVNEPVTLTK